MRRLGLADGLGLVAVLTAIVWLPGAADPLTWPKLIFLAGGGLALAPFVAYRWVQAGKPAIGPLIIAIAAVGIVVWGLVSTFASGAPWAISLFGWWGRGDGWLAWLGAAVLLLGAASLRGQEIRRAVSWLLGGATFVAALSLLQALGLQVPGDAVGGSVVGTMGNTNFAGGYFAIVASLALGRLISRGPTWERAWGGVLFVVLAVLAVLTQTQQGPAALGAGVLAAGACYALMYRGRGRALGLAATGGAAAVVLGLLVASAFAIGPLARLWSENTFAIRQEYWKSAVSIMLGRPFFGTGPDSFSRYVAEYRPESYVELLGPQLRVSAAHNVALQFGATAGLVGLILWLLLFGSISVMLLVRVLRRSDVESVLVASVAGAFVAYLVQGMVSIDMLPLLATGWTVAGLAVASARIPSAEQPASSSPSTRKDRARRARQDVASAGPPAGLLIAGAGLGILGVAGVGSQIAAANAVMSINSLDEGVSFVTSALTPCPLRAEVTKQIIESVAADVSVPTTISATNLDDRCPPMINYKADVTVQQGLLQDADSASRLGIEYDPLLDIAWVIRGRYLLSTGDFDGARAAAEEARRLQELYPESFSDVALVDNLVKDIDDSEARLK